MGLAGRLESGNEERIVLAGRFPSGVACELGIVERFCLELPHRLSLPGPCRWWAGRRESCCCSCCCCSRSSCRASSAYGGIATSVHGTCRGTVLQQIVHLGWVESQSGKTRAVQSLVLPAGQAVSAGVVWAVVAAHGCIVGLGWVGSFLDDVCAQNRFGSRKEGEGK